MGEMRCHSCREFGIECPKGYTNSIMRCDTCGRRVLMTAAACAWDRIDPCSVCGGSWSEEELRRG